jgi:ATP-dependent Clp protease ATP-binding subunit ClpC
VAIWTHRCLLPADAPRALRLAAALRAGLVDGTDLEPIILLLSHVWFGADGPAPRVEGLRGLFVQYPGSDATAALGPICQRSRTLAAGEWGGLEEVLGVLTG